ncbi:MAG: hypothetical protein ABUS49_06900 [Acidobacteriota bacterium]
MPDAYGFQDLSELNNSALALKSAMRYYREFGGRCDELPAL